MESVPGLVNRKGRGLGSQPEFSCCGRMGVTGPGGGTGRGGAKEVRMLCAMQGSGSKVRGSGVEGWVEGQGEV